MEEERQHKFKGAEKEGIHKRHSNKGKITYRREIQSRSSVFAHTVVAKT